MGAFRDQRRTVETTPEFHRIRELPRRTWNDADLEKLAEEMTRILKTPEGQWSLRPKQALALHDFGVYGGLVGLLRVGAGKTLITYLLPKMLETKPRSPILILPANLIEKTERERETLSKHWQIAKNLRLVSYEMLGRLKGADVLTTYTPDLIILDECHRAKSRKAGVTRRLLRYMHERPDTHVAVLSGTLVKKGLKDAAHLIRWALKDGSPIPMKDGELAEWGDALDENVNPLRRFRPGPLLTLSKVANDGDDLAMARRAFHARLIETPGVVATGGEQVDCSLNITAQEYAEHPATNAHFETLRKAWATPDGWTLSEAVAVWACARQLALGFHYVNVGQEHYTRWMQAHRGAGFVIREDAPADLRASYDQLLADGKAPEDWLLARRGWASFVRKTLSHSRHLDTELQVRNAVKSGAIRSPELHTWEGIQPSFTPVLMARFHDASALEACQAWMKTHAGICWVEHTIFAEELSRRSGVPYYGAQGKTAKGDSIVDLAESADAGRVPIIASIAANGTGRNLQAWSENLITTGITQAADLEQLLGRTHRDGQKADEVNVEMLFGCWEHFDAWQKARAQAAATLDTYGADQKLLVATVDMPGEFDVANRPGARWHKNVAVEKLDIWG